MKLRKIMLLKAIVCLVFALGLLFFPFLLMSIYGMNLDEGGIVMARLYGASFSGTMVLMWLAYNVNKSEALKAIVTAQTVYNTIGFVVTLFAVTSGVMNLIGLSAVVIYGFFMVGFGYHMFVMQE